ncbi:MAG: hypothetical protein R3C14_23910 [Caldilineaceae bacterium]
MIARKIHSTVKQALARQATVALIGLRQIGKTTLALEIAEEMTSLYLDLEAQFGPRIPAQTLERFWTIALTSIYYVVLFSIPAKNVIPSPKV